MQHASFRHKFDNFARVQKPEVKIHIFESSKRKTLIKPAHLAKYFASEAAVANSQEAMRVFGGYSYSKEYDIERFYRDSMLMCIGEGTNEMQRMIISKQWVKRNPA